MDTPSGRTDLISDVEQEIAEQEQALNAKRAELAKIKNEPVVVDEDGKVLAADEVHESDWPHAQIEYKGEVWNVRKPQPQALTMFAIATGKYVPELQQRDIMSLFLTRHLSPKSFLRFTERMIDPEEPDFDQASMGEMMRKISTLGTSRPTGPSRG